MKNRFPDSFLPHSPDSSFFLLEPSAPWARGSEAVTRIHHVPGDFNKEVALCKAISAEIFSLVPPWNIHQQDFSSGIELYSWQTQPRFVFSTVLERCRGRTDVYPQRSQGTCLLKAISSGLTSEGKDATKKFRNLCSSTDNRAGTDLINSSILNLFPYPSKRWHHGCVISNIITTVLSFLTCSSDPFWKKSSDGDSCVSQDKSLWYFTILFENFLWC